jgi:hypothetical protein
MKTTYILAFLLYSYSFVYAQHDVKSDTIVPAKGNSDKQLEKIKEKKIELHSDTLGNEPEKSERIDTTLHNKYGDLLVDDPEYNKRYSIWKPSAEVLGAIILTWAMDRYLLNADYARIGIKTWKYNLQKGWEWDNDRFGVNFIGHPYSGTLSINAARSNGYNYFQSIPFAVGGSLLWEYFGENTRPSYNDIIYTPVNGTFLGEILYRLSSNILDDRTRGADRVFREIAAGLVDPMRGFNRLLQGKSFRHTNKEVYAKEPINISFYTGLRQLNDKTERIFGKSTYSALFNLQIDYGNPFEVRSRKPFDFFKLRGDINIGVGRKYLDNILGYGILYGKNMQWGKMAILIGAFQYYDYWDSRIFELGTIGFGGGVISKLLISKTSNFYNRLHLAIVPFAGNSTIYGPDTSQFRDYNYGGGLEGKFESVININKYATVSMIYYFYWIRTYIGIKGDNLVHILKPRMTVRLYKILNIGIENDFYYNDRYLADFPTIHLARTEQKIFLLLYFEDKQRRGHYN